MSIKALPAIQVCYFVCYYYQDKITDTIYSVGATAGRPPQLVPFPRHYSDGFLASTEQPHHILSGVGLSPGLHTIVL